MVYKLDGLSYICQYLHIDLTRRILLTDEQNGNRCGRVTACIQRYTCNLIRHGGLCRAVPGGVMQHTDLMHVVESIAYRGNRTHLTPI